MQYKTFQEAINNTDWRLLQQQKRTLEKLIASMSRTDKRNDISNTNIFNLWGLIEFIETLQDIQSNETM